MFKKILIANRSEIARRIIAAAKEMDIQTVAIYSDPDAQAIFVREADEAYPLNGIEAKETYLDVEKVLAIAKTAGVDAIHPGYGFLSENADFASSCAQAQIKFIGPSPEVIKKLGSKTASKEIAKIAKVPSVPGMQTFDEKNIKEIESKVGFPLLIKAAAGGGGKGMRIVTKGEEFTEALQAAKREGLAFFKDDTVFIERYIENPKHIEVQLLGDEHGNLIHLFERECSVQRRHQKMIEESPSPSLNPKLRQKICEAAIKIAKAAHYSSAGTAEFLLDHQGNFYFLEVNTRLQVEHPITEAVTGIDLVKAQIRIAAGEKLWLKQKDIVQRGHAIECRLYAEDPENNFLPSDGKVGLLFEPSRPGIRIDSALEQGQDILPYYDPMLAKLITWGADRPEALIKTSKMLADFILLGTRHNLDFLGYTLAHPDFIDGTYHTHSVAKWIDPYLSLRKEEAQRLEGLADLLAKTKTNTAQQPTKSFAGNNFTLKELENFRNV
ncbi:MAG: ATP-grasp domain-containing protein [Deltaproteobacteria bacterium]|nr:ATP-grasp domain-containing protein [Deltaproteobacteria bacterium]